MNNKKGIIPLTLVFLLIFVAACKKYDEGPLISLRSKEKRLCQKWTLKEAYVNGDKGETDPTNMEFTKNNKWHFVSYGSNDTTVEDMTWQWVDNKNVIELNGEKYFYQTTYDSISGEYIIDSVLTSYKNVFNIKKLTMKEFYYETDTVILNEHYTFTFKYESDD